MIRSNPATLPPTVLEMEARAAIRAGVSPYDFVEVVARPGRPDQAIVLGRQRTPLRPSAGTHFATWCMLIGREDDGPSAGRIITTLVWGHYDLTQAEAEQDLRERA